MFTDIVSTQGEEGLDGAAHLSVIKVGEGTHIGERDDKVEDNRWETQEISHAKQRQVIPSRWSQRGDVQTPE